MGRWGGAWDGKVGWVGGVGEGLGEGVQGRCGVMGLWSWGSWGACFPGASLSCASLLPACVLPTAHDDCPQADEDMDGGGGDENRGTQQLTQTQRGGKGAAAAGGRGKAAGGAGGGAKRAKKAALAEANAAD
mgnify:CR=1 FL=1